MQLNTILQVSGLRKSHLAKLLGITPGAITYWDGVIPEHRVWQLKAMRPVWFKKLRQQEAEKQKAETA